MVRTSVCYIFDAVTVVKRKPDSTENNHFHLKLYIVTSKSWTVSNEIIIAWSTKQCVMFLKLFAYIFLLPSKVHLG